MEKITDMMAKTIQEKEREVKKLNELVDQCTAMEIKERNKRAKIMNDLSESGVKMTEKVKVAKCDELLKSEMGQIAHLKKDIGKLKRAIDLHNDKLSLCRNMLRELELLG